MIRFLLEYDLNEEQKIFLMKNILDIFNYKEPVKNLLVVLLTELLI